MDPSKRNECPALKYIIVDIFLNAVLIGDIFLNAVTLLLGLP